MEWFFYGALVLLALFLIFFGWLFNNVLSYVFTDEGFEPYPNWAVDISFLSILALAVGFISAFVWDVLK